MLPGTTGAGAVAVLVMCSWAIGVAVEQRGSVFPAGQLLPGMADVTALASTPSPLTGSDTVTEYFTVTAAPGARPPVHVRRGLTKAVAPEVAVASALYVASSRTAVRSSAKLPPTTAARPVLVAVTV